MDISKGTPDFFTDITTAYLLILTQINPKFWICSYEFLYLYFIVVSFFCPQDILNGLQQKGHSVRARSGILAVVQNVLNTCPDSMEAVVREQCIFASSDGAKVGKPDGY